jgi:hypothetical protein
LPVDASWTYERVVGASGGIVPDRQTVRAQLRLYFGIFQRGTASSPRN